MQSNFDKFQAEIRQAKNASGCTIQELADGSGVPLDFASSITSGAAKRPSLYYSAAVCAYFRLSMDELLGVPVDHAQNADIDEAVRAENEMLKADNHKLEIENACMKYDVEHFKKEAQAYRPLMFCLMGLCVLLLIFVIGYVVWDYSQKHAGLFRITDISLGAIIIAVVILVSITVLCAALMWLIKSLKRSQD